MAKSLLNTKLGVFVSSVAKMSVHEIKKEAYNDSVLTQMADLNTDSQLYDKGVLADGSSTPDYSYVTVEYKRAENKRYDHMTFKDTGEMYESVKYYYNGQLKAYWLDRYNLEIKYGEIIGLTSESIKFIQPEIVENIQESILRKL